jgi:hypothetical protein
MKEEIRGSEELFKRLSQPVEISQEALHHVVRVAEGASARILDWTILGRPAFERLRASFDVKPDQLPAFIEGLVGSKARFGYRVFPKGVPPIIDGYQVEIDNLMAGH